MRITERQSVETLLSSLGQLKEAHNRNLQDLATGKRLHKSSDNPLGTGQLIGIQKALVQAERYQKNIDDAKLWLNLSETALSAISEDIEQARGVASNASGSSVDEESKQLWSSQIQTIMESVMSYVNQKNGSKYIFGGTAIDSPPFSLSTSVSEESFVSALDTPVELGQTGLSSAAVTVTSEDGLTTFQEHVDFELDRELGTITALSTGSMADAATYLISYETNEATVVSQNPAGTDGGIMRQIMDNETIQVNISGQDAFAGDQDIFQALIDLKNAIVRGDSEAVQDAASALKSGRDQVNRYTGLAGLKYARLSEVSEDLDSLSLHLKDFRSTIEDADTTETAVNIQALEATYEATLSASSKIFQMSLLDYLA
jgi:flagellar hook-associated protein 3 FlgL